MVARSSDDFRPVANPVEIKAWRARLELAEARFVQALATAKSQKQNDALRDFGNALIRFWLEVGAANDEIGHPFSSEVVKAITKAAWPSRSVSAAEMRAIATSLAYRLNVRLDESGAKDSRMDAAMLAAARLEGSDSSEAAETIRKSIQRFRAKARGQTVFRLDPDTLQISHHDAEEALLPGLPGKRGRPRKTADQA